MRRVFHLLCSAVLVSAAMVFAFSSPASATSYCKDVSAYRSGPNITATNIRVSGMGCTRARKLLRKYFRLVLDTAQTPDGCAQLRAEDGCYVDGFKCTVRGTRQLRGRCGRGKGSKQKIIRFTEYDTGPG